MTARYIGLLLLSLHLCATHSLAATATQLQQQSQQALQQEIATQQQVDHWSEAKQALVNELLDQKTQLEWNRFQNKKFRQYIDHKRGTIADLKRQKEQMGMLRKQLEPFLDSSIEDLQTAIAADLPFLPQERQERQAFLARSLTDPELSLSEKLRRVLEALQVEADYGNSVEVTEETLPLDGEATMVQILRLGRTGLFYLSLDGENIGRWDPKRAQWVPLDAAFKPAVQTTIDVIRQKRAAELVDLPLPAIAHAETEAAQ